MDHILAAVEDICGRIGDNWWTRGYAFLPSVNNLKYLYELNVLKLNVLILTLRWKRFEEKYICRILMKPKARKNKDYLFNVFHKLNLEDAMNYVSEVRS